MDENDIIELTKLSNDNTVYLYDKSKSEFIVFDKITKDVHKTDTLLPDQLEIFMKEYSDQIFFPKQQNIRRNSILTEPNIVPLHENKGFKFFYDIVDDIIIQENKIDKHVSRFSVSDDIMAQLSPENQRMIRLNQINLQQHKNQPYKLRSHEDPTNFSDTVVQRPPLVKRKNVRHLE